MVLRGPFFMPLTPCQLKRLNRRYFCAPPKKFQLLSFPRHRTRSVHVPSLLFSNVPSNKPSPTLSIFMFPARHYLFKSKKPSLLKRFSKSLNLCKNIPYFKNFKTSGNNIMDVCTGHPPETIFDKVA